MKSNQDKLIRAFVAIEVPAEIKSKLEQVSQGLAALELDGRRSRVESLHLTLQFLGRVPPPQIDAIKGRLATATGDLGSFDVSVQGFGVFPHLARPRVVWVGIASNQPLAQLHSRVQQSLEPLGFQPEKRSFKPHLTLMRLKSQRHYRALVSYVQATAGESFGQFTVSEYHLYQSLLHPQGARYSKLASFPLK